jgi:hypothetical protein
MRRIAGTHHRCRQRDGREAAAALPVDGDTGDVETGFESSDPGGIAPGTAGHSDNDIVDPRHHARLLGD